MLYTVLLFMLIALLRRQPGRAMCGEQSYVIKPGRCQNRKLALLHIFYIVSETVKTQHKGFYNNDIVLRLHKSVTVVARHMPFHFI